MSGFTDGNYNAMLDILLLYSKVITADEFVEATGTASHSAA